MPTSLFDQVSRLRNVIDLTGIQYLSQKDQDAIQETVKPQVSGYGEAIDGTSFHNRSLAKTKATTYFALKEASVSNETNTIPDFAPPAPPAPPMVEPPPPPPTPPVVEPPSPPPPPEVVIPRAGAKTTAKAGLSPPDESHTKAHLNAIQRGVKLKKVGTKKADKKAEAKLKQTENPIEGITARDILYSASWEKIKMQLGVMVINAQGLPGDNIHLNRLMKRHAEYANKEGKYSAINEKGQKVDGLIYKSYVCGRDKSVDLLGRKKFDGIQIRKNDNNNDFNTSIMSFLDTYLDTLSKIATDFGSDLFTELNKMFEINPTIESPRQLFENWPILRDKCKKVRIEADMLIPDDVTEEFIDAIMHSEDNPEVLKKHMLKVFERRMSGLEKLANIVDIDLSSVKKQIKRKRQ